jgi:hypothetical protein
MLHAQELEKLQLAEAPAKCLLQCLCGSVDTVSALQLFDGISIKNNVVWTLQGSRYTSIDHSEMSFEHELFQSMIGCNLFVWTPSISEFVKDGDNASVAELFVAMRSALVEQTLMVANCVAQACIASLMLRLRLGASGEVSAWIRPIPWPFLIMSVGCYISWEVSEAWKPPWSFQSWQSIKVMSALREILKFAIDVPNMLKKFSSPSTFCTSNNWHSFLKSKVMKTCVICLTTMKPGQGHTLFTARCSHTLYFYCISANVKHGSSSYPVC